MQTKPIETNYIYQGCKLCIAGKYQKMSLSPDVIVSDEFREKFNEWLGGFFGYGEIVPDGEILHAPHLNTMTMNEATYYEFVKALERGRE